MVIRIYAIIIAAGGPIALFDLLLFNGRLIFWTHKKLQEMLTSVLRKQKSTKLTVYTPFSHVFLFIVTYSLWILPLLMFLSMQGYQHLRYSRKERERRNRLRIHRRNSVLALNRIQAIEREEQKHEQELARLHEEKHNLRGQLRTSDAYREAAIDEAAEEEIHQELRSKT